MFVFLAAFLCLTVGRTAAGSTTKVYVVLWFDTEDYLLPASDDAALRLAQFLSDEGVRATFKVVGEKARTLERRKRTDVIDALKKHEIGFHANWHSVQPSPALYLSQLGWDEGVGEFDRREGPGRADVERIFAQAPTCYGQPGSSWGPQSYGAMSRWGMKVYLDAGTHVKLDGKPCFYCGMLNLYNLTYFMRADLNKPSELAQAEERFARARKELMEQGGGLVSTMYHPCEFVHKKFWDGVNFARGENPPREKWKLPPQKTAEETRKSYAVFEEYVRFIKRFPEVRFITASEAAKLYRDRATEKQFTPAEVEAVASAVADEVSFQSRGDYALCASEVFALLNAHMAGASLDQLRVQKFLGPTGRIPVLTQAITTDDSQFSRTCQDVADYLDKHGRIPSAVWLGSRSVPPEAYLAALARMVLLRLEGKPLPETISIAPAKLAAARYVSDDDSQKLWNWVIFPPNFRAPALMELARKQAWTLKPAILDRRLD
jgi:hypothetical protein